MKDAPKTILFLLAAVALCAVAFVTKPKAETDEIFSDLGAEFYPEFKEALDAAEMEIVGVDDLTKQLIPFKVALKDGRWVLPSYSDYPSDVKDKVEKIAANLIQLKKDVLRSSLPNDHEALEVVDPADESPTGKGIRITLKNKSGSVLCDYIFGKRVEGKSGYRYVRIPNQPKTYETKVDLTISTKFSDWVETGLLAMTNNDATKLISLDYSVTQGQKVTKDRYALMKEGTEWKADKVPDAKELDAAKITSILTAFSDLKLAGVRKKPDSLIELLNGKSQSVTPEAQISLQSKGFYITQNGLVGDEGEFIIAKSNGVAYNIFFGVSFKDDSIQIQGDGNDKKEKDSGRYMFLTVSYDKETNKEPKILEAPAKPKDDAPEAEKKKYDEAFGNYNKSVADNESWKKDKKEAEEEVARLQKRFNDWYYVIADETYKKVKVKFAELLKDKAKPKEEGKPGGPGVPPLHPKLPGLPK